MIDRDKLRAGTLTLKALAMDAVRGRAAYISFYDRPMAKLPRTLKEDKSYIEKVARANAALDDLLRATPAETEARFARERALGERFAREMEKRRRNQIKEAKRLRAAVVAWKPGRSLGKIVKRALLNDLRTLITRPDVEYAPSPLTAEESHAADIAEARRRLMEAKSEFARHQRWIAQANIELADFYTSLDKAVRK